MATDIYVNQENYVDGDTKPSGAFLGQKLKATNGKVWEWTGTTWALTVDVSSDGSNAGAVALKDGAGNGVVGSSYDGDKTVASASSTREAIASGTESLEVYNQGATNFMRFRFGDSTVDATITTGFFLAAGERLSVPVPGTATHWAYIANTADVTASVVWGG